MVSDAIILPVRTGQELAAAARLFRDYEASIDTDLCFRGFEAELAGLPGQYALPSGALFIAQGPDGEGVGCAALRPVEDDGVCEMKRLYVAPQGRGLCLGKALMQAVIGEARRIGYREIAPCYDTPVGGTLFMALDLTA